MLVADYLCFCLLVIQLCSAELAQLALADLLTLFKYLSSAGCFLVYQIYVFSLAAFLCPYDRLSGLLR